MTASDSPWPLRPADPELARACAQELGLSPLLARLLAARVADMDQAMRYLGYLPWTFDPFALPGIEAASLRLLDAKDAGEPVLVYGDYDADGVTSTSLLYSYLARSGYNAHYFLPNRFEDGYGMNMHALENLANRGHRLIVTVDNGISSVAEVAFARELGMDVIVTDHHTPPAILPEAFALINPRLGGCPPEMVGLAGVGVAFTLAAALERLSPAEGIEDLLDLVAIGSVADMAPLTGLNRAFVAQGIHRIATNPRPGLRAIAETAAINLAEMSAAEVGYRVGPRINAAGRMDHPEAGLRLFLAEDMPGARAAAAELERLNRLRQDTSRRIEAEALAMIEAAPAGALVLAQEDWHPGVLGIVAARLSETYGVPALMLCAEGDRWKGSGRSPDSVHLFRALEGCRDLLLRFGGHAQAVGLALDKANLEAFRDRLVAEIRFQSSGPVETMVVDAELRLAELSPQLIRELEQLEPTGQANPAPVLAFRDVAVVSQKRRGKAGEHLFLEVRDGLEIREVVGFGMGELHPLPERVDLAGTPELNTWQGRTRVQLRLQAIQPAKTLASRV